MKEKKLTIMAYLLVFLMPFAVSALEIKTNTHTYGGSGNDSIKEMVATTDGGYAILVETDSTDIENVTFKGDEDGLIVKYDKDGNIAWQRVYGGTSRDRMYSITATNDGGVVIAGETFSTDIEGLINKGSTDGVIVKYDKDGNIAWQKSYGEETSESFRKIINTSDNGYIVAGSVTDDTLVIKYDSNGNIEWTKRNGGSGSDWLENIIEIEDGYIIYGTSLSNDFPNLQNDDYQFYFSMKLDKEGNVKWSQAHEHGEKFVLEEMIPEETGGYYFLESKYGETDEDCIIYSIITKYKNDGTIEWQKDTNKKYENYNMNAIRFAKTADGGYWLYQIYSQVDTNEMKVIDYDSVLYKYDSKGELEWERSVKTDDLQYIRRLVETTSGKIILSIQKENQTENTDIIIDELSIEYSVTVNSTKNGTYNVEQFGNKGIVTLSPNKNYELDDLLVKNSKGKELNYQEDKDEQYSFYIYDDVSVNVTYKEKVTNPNTSIFFRIGFLFIPLLVAYFIHNSEKIKFKKYTN